MSEQNSEKTYILANLESPYGIISPEYADANKYPFVVFTYDSTTKSVKCIAGFSCWADVNNGGASNPYGALVCAKDNAWRQGGAIVLLRRDYDIQTGSYNNLCHANGTITLDLGGNTLTGGSGILFAASNKKSHNTTIITKNGTILLETAELVTLMAGDAGNGSKFIITFEDVNIGFAKNATITRIVETFGATVSNSTVCYADISFINCVIDLRTNAPAGKVISFFNGVNDEGHYKADVVIKGGSMIAGDADNLVIYNVDNNANAPDSFSFAKNDSGVYMTLTLPVGVNAPDTVFNTPDGDVIFVKQSESGDTVVYKLRTNSLKIMSAFLNLTSDINVYFRTNVPAGYENPYMEFVFNGNTYTVTEYFIDETGLYCFAFKDIAPQYMGQIIEATLYATKGGEQESVSNNKYSILSYCKCLLENYASNDTLVALVSDLLVYGAKAQIYAGSTDALVTEGLTLNASTFTELDKSSDKIALSGASSELVAWKSVGLYLENDMSLKLSFTAVSTEGLTVEITVKDTPYVIDVSALEPDGNGVYSIYFDGILAADFDETVTAVFKLNVEQVGYTLTYSANSYVYRMQNADDTATKELVRALYNYGRSANAYLG